VALKKAGDAHRERVTDLERDICQWQARAEGEKLRAEEVLIDVQSDISCD